MDGRTLPWQPPPTDPSPPAAGPLECPGQARRGPPTARRPEEWEAPRPRVHCRPPWAPAPQPPPGGSNDALRG
eukprot:3138371-Alexandrium_andersonii.AAC.1